MPASTRLMILPGIGNSGPDHWQSHWERHDTRCLRLLQDEWERPRCADWVQALTAAVTRESRPVVLVAHSSACALVAHWAAGSTPALQARIRGAFLVAPSDPEGPNYPIGPTGFAPMPRARLPFAAIVVASTDDPYISLSLASAYASDWGARFVAIESAGHVNVASGHGPWPQGYALLTAFIDATARPATAG